MGASKRGDIDFGTWKNLGGGSPAHGSGRPGLMTLGRADSHGGTLPTSLPSSVFTTGQFGLFDSPAGESLTGAPGASTIYQPHEKGFWNQDKFRGGSDLGTGGERGFTDAGPRFEEAQSEDFKNWYDQYVGLAVDKPMQQIRSQGFQRASELGLDPGVLEGYSGAVPDPIENLGLGDYEFAGEGPIVAKGLGSQITDKQYQLDQDLEESAAIQSQLDKDLDLKKEGRAKDLAAQDLLRSEALTSQGTQAQQRAAAIAKTGMDYSGPAMAMANIGKEAGMADLSQIAQDKKDIQRQFELEKAEILDAKAREEQNVEDYKRNFGVGVRDVLSKSSEDIQGLLTSMEGIPKAHQAFGEYLDTSLSAPTYGKYGGQAGEVVEGGQLSGKSTYGGPSEGWFTEGMGRGPVQRGFGDIAAADEFIRWIDTVAPEAWAANVDAEGGE